MYRVTLILGTPGKQVFYQDIDFRQLLESGESLLAPPPEVTNLKVELFNDKERAEVIFSTNPKGTVANAQMRITAANFLDARRKATDLIMPVLSRWSFDHDVAVDVVGYEIYEEHTDSRAYGFGVVGQVVALQATGGISKPEHRAIVSAYREALNALNVFYQFLCYSRVMEGTLRLRGARRERAVSQGVAYHEPGNEKRIPDRIEEINVPDDFEREMFRPYLGQKFMRVREGFRNVLRNALAHLDPERDLVADKFDDTLTCERAIPVMKYMSRIMLLNELAADPDLLRRPPESLP